MCGINGIISEVFESERSLDIVKRMNQRLAHRGPDHDGIYQKDNICLGHRRLSIIDISAAGNQPFFSADGRYVIVYNGELYNYRDLKLELQRAPHGSNYLPYFFKTASDTEVILAAFIRWGAQCLQYFNGMFAFCIYDSQTETSFIARDRLGVKPLYYHHGGDSFIFSSEIRPILHSGVKSFGLDADTLSEYFMYQTVHAPRTIIKGIKMLMPGHYIEYHKGKAELTQYYDVNKIKTEGSDRTYAQVCSETEQLLTHSVQRRLVADVPFGAFLSGGIDSSAVVGLMSKVSQEKILTFNVSFDESDFSESVYAKQIAQRFNTEHHEIKLRPADFLNELPEALHALDHPGGDGPNTYIVSKATREKGIKMALSGIGGDELFAGYDVFKRMHELNNKAWLNALPRIARMAGGKFIELKKKGVSGKKISELLSQQTIDFTSAYPLNRSIFTKKELSQLIKGSDPFARLNEITSSVPQKKDYLLSAVSLCEISSYLQNVLLRDTDQMSMAVALEVREPFLDHRLVEFVLGVNDEMKFPHTPKKLLTDSLKGLLPDEIIHRPKMGFTLPWKYWMQNELRSFCEKNIQELSELPACNKNEVRLLWDRFLKGDPAVTWSRIWHLVVLNNWIKENKVAYSN